MTTGVLGMVVGGGQGSEAGGDRSCLPPPHTPTSPQAGRDSVERSLSDFLWGQVLAQLRAPEDRFQKPQREHFLSPLCGPDPMLSTTQAVSS